MRRFQFIMIAVLFVGCASVPKQLVDAMQVQQDEIARVKKMYFDNMINQLNTIEKYRLAVLDIYEVMYKKDIRKAPNTKKKENGEIVVVLDSPSGEPLLDVYNVAMLEKLEHFFDVKRDSVREDIRNRRQMIFKANQNFENIEEINSAVNEYLQSLVRLKESRDQFAQSLRNKVGKIAPIPISWDKIPDPKTIEDLLGTLKKQP